MATTGFWPVKGNIKDLIKYAENPAKTTNPQYDKDLANTLKYVENSEKTDMQLYVSGINCTAKRAYQQMQGILLIINEKNLLKGNCENAKLLPKQVI